MARLRFPGRPGLRFDRLGVHYGVDESCRGLDPTTRLIANIHRGLRHFRELFGESDEEDFDGFTEKDVTKACRRLKTILKEEKELLAPVEVQSLPRNARSARATAETQIATPHKTYTQLIKSGIVKPTKAHLEGTVKEIKSQVVKSSEKSKDHGDKKEKKGKPLMPRSPRRQSPEFKHKPGSKLGNIRIKFRGGGKNVQIVGGRGRPGRPSTIKSSKERGSLETSPKIKKHKSLGKKTPSPKKKDKNETTKPVKRGPGRPKKENFSPKKPVRSTKLARVKQLLSQAKRGRQGRSQLQVKSQVKDRRRSGSSRRSSRDSVSGNSGSPKRRTSKDRTSLGARTTPPAKPKQFVLPAVSSRSSRIIIPNKRFIEEEYSGITTKKSKTDLPSPKKSVLPGSGFGILPLHVETGLTSPSTSVAQVAPAFGQPGSLALPVRPPPGYAYVPVPVEVHAEGQTGTGLLDQPLIVEGKRHRKPSMKLIMKLTDEDSEAKKLENRKRIEERKRLYGEDGEEVYLSGEEEQQDDTMLDEKGQAMPLGKSERQKLAELERTAEATKRSGQNILRKAMLQLNRAALNRSKAALARSLKYKMKKEEARLKQEREQQEAQKLSSTFGSLGGLSGVPLSPIKMAPFGSQPIAMAGTSLPTGLPTFAAERGSLPSSSLAHASSTSGAISPQSKEGKKVTALEKRKEQAALKREQSRKKMVMSLSVKKCAICGHNRSKKYNRNYGVPSCPPCNKFYRTSTLQRIRDGKLFRCSKNGKCKISSVGRKQLDKCTACHYRKCQKFFPPPQFMKDMASHLKESTSSAKKRKTRTSLKLESQATGKGPLHGEERKVLEGKPLPLAAPVMEDEPLLQHDPNNHGNPSVSPLPAPVSQVEAVVDEQAPIDQCANVTSSSDLKPHQDLRARTGLRGSLDAMKPPEIKISFVPTQENQSIRDEEDAEVETYNTDHASLLNVSRESLPIPDSPDSTSSAAGSVTSGHGPRIKHVCRKAAVALGLGSPAVFPRRELRLSALPSQEKQKILEKEELKRPGTPDSDDMSIEEIILRARREDDVITIKKAPSKNLKALVRPSKKQTTEDGDLFEYKYCKTKSKGVRRLRCRECAGCRAVDCGQCAHCRDMIKYGGKGTLKKACVDRQCENPQYPTPGMRLIKVKKKANDNFSGSSIKVTRRDDDDFTGEGGEGSSCAPSAREPRVQTTAVSRQSDASGTSVSAGSSVSYGKSTSDRSPMCHRLPTRNSKKDKLTILPAVVPPPTRVRWPTLLDKDIIDPFFKESYDIDVAWCRGLALIASIPMCVRTVCFLCASAGQHELVYCNICCEPFHLFCLEDHERPVDSNKENWCCRRCQFCHSCGKQHNLLQCDRCRETYHPRCLGSNYPTKPSANKKIWICTKCVKCKSCGATTPGPNGVTWTYDFSLCHECGQLMDKGNYCPVCHKCYSDDDWESKMIQCSSCENWVHAKCEGVTDEMYEILSHLPDDVMFNCRVCYPAHPAPWERTLQRTLQEGLNSIIGMLSSSKCTQHLSSIEDQVQEEEPLLDAAAMETVMTSIDLQVLETAQNMLSQVCQEDDETVPGVKETDEDLTAKQDSLPDDLTVSLSQAIGSQQIEKNLLMLSEDNSEGQNTFRTAVSEMDNNANSSVTDGPAAVDSSRTSISTVHKDNSAEQTVESVVSSSDCNSAKTPNRISIVSNAKLEIEPKLPGQGSLAVPEKTHMQVVDCDNDKATAGVVVTNQKSNDVDNPEISEETQKKIPSEQRHPSDVSHELQIPRHLADSVRGDLDNASVADPASISVESGAMATGEVVTYTDKSALEEGGNLLPASGSMGKEMSCETLTNDTDLENIQNLHTSENPVVLNIVDDSGEEMTQVLALPTEPVLDSETGQQVMYAVLLNGDVDSQGNLSTMLNSSQELMEPMSSSTDTASETSQLCATMGLTQQTKSTKSEIIKDFPRDLKAVKKKMSEGKYFTVEEFSDDIVRIIQYNLSLGEMATSCRGKAHSIVRSLFCKSMERSFPWFNVNRSRLWNHNQNLPEGMLPQAVLPPYNDHTYAQWLARPEGPLSPQPSPFKRIPNTPQKFISLPMAPLDDDAVSVATSDSDLPGDDTRRCGFCGKYGDDRPDDAGRLLYASQDDWVHVNCALWSAEVFEEVDGTLQYVHAAMARGRQMKCELCKKNGATVGCCYHGCSSSFHFMCARVSRCLFQEDKKVFCRAHAQLIDGELVENNKFAVLRRACAEMEGTRWQKKTWSKGLDPSVINVLVGSMTVESLGQLAPLSDCKAGLFPIGFCCTRIYWSTVDARRRCVYTCRIVEVRPASLSPEIKVKDMTVIHDETHPNYDPALVVSLASMTTQAPPKEGIIGSHIPEDMDVTGYEGDKFCEPRNAQTPINKPASIKRRIAEASHMNDSTRQGRPSNLSKSYPGRRLKQLSDHASLCKSWPDQQQTYNLGVLSEKTRKLLSPANLSKFQGGVASKTSQQDNFPLIQMADRLNRAAAKNKRGRPRIYPKPPDRARYKEDQDYTPPADTIRPVKRRGRPRVHVDKTKKQQPDTESETEEQNNSDTDCFPVKLSNRVTRATSQSVLEKCGHALTVDVQEHQDYRKINVSNVNVEISSRKTSQETKEVKLVVKPGQVGAVAKVTAPTTIGSPPMLSPTRRVSVDHLRTSLDEVINKTIEGTLKEQQKSNCATLVDGVKQQFSVSQIANTSAPDTESQESQHSNAVQQNMSLGKRSASRGTEGSGLDQEHLQELMKRLKRVAQDNPGAISQLMTLNTKSKIRPSSLPSASEDSYAGQPHSSSVHVDKQVSEGLRLQEDTLMMSDDNVTQKTDSDFGNTTLPSKTSASTDQKVHDPVQVVKLIKERQQFQYEGVEAVYDSEGKIIGHMVECPTVKNLLKQAETNQRTSKQKSSSSHMLVTSSNSATHLTTDGLNCVAAQPKVGLSVSESQRKNFGQCSPGASSQRSVTLPTMSTIGKTPVAIVRPNNQELVEDTPLPAPVLGSSSSATQVPGAGPLLPHQEGRQDDGDKEGDHTQSDLMHSLDGQVDTMRDGQEEPVLNQSTHLTNSSKNIDSVNCIESAESTRKNITSSHIVLHSAMNLSCVPCLDGQMDSDKEEESDTKDCQTIATRRRSQTGAGQEVKSYPLRRTVARQSNEGELPRKLEHNQRSRAHHLPEATVVLQKLTTEAVRRLSRELKDSNEHSSGQGEIAGGSALHDKIVQRIKAESLARSVPSKEGPFKCPTCKRLYRTRQSFETHVKSCDFVVSSEDEEDEERDMKDCDWNPDYKCDIDRIPASRCGSRSRGASSEKGRGSASPPDVRFRKMSTRHSVSSEGSVFEESETGRKSASVSPVAAVKRWGKVPKIRNKESAPSSPSPTPEDELLSNNLNPVVRLTRSSGGMVCRDMSDFPTSSKSNESTPVSEGMFPPRRRGRPPKSSSVSNTTNICESPLEELNSCEKIPEQNLAVDNNAGPLLDSLACIHSDELNNKDITDIPSDKISNSGVCKEVKPPGVSALNEQDDEVVFIVETKPENKNAASNSSTDTENQQSVSVPKTSSGLPTNLSVGHHDSKSASSNAAKMSSSNVPYVTVAKPGSTRVITILQKSKPPEGKTAAESKNSEVAPLCHAPLAHTTINVSTGKRLVTNSLVQDSKPNQKANSCKDSDTADRESDDSDDVIVVGVEKAGTCVQTDRNQICQQRLVRKPSLGDNLSAGTSVAQSTPTQDRIVKKIHIRPAVVQIPKSSQGQPSQQRDLQHLQRPAFSQPHLGNNAQPRLQQPRQTKVVQSQSNQHYRGQTGQRLMQGQRNPPPRILPRSMPQTFVHAAPGPTQQTVLHQSMGLAGQPVMSQVPIQPQTIMPQMTPHIVAANNNSLANIPVVHNPPVFVEAGVQNASIMTGQIQPNVMANSLPLGAMVPNQQQLVLSPPQVQPGSIPMQTGSIQNLNVQQNITLQLPSIHNPALLGNLAQIASMLTQNLTQSGGVIHVQSSQPVLQPQIPQVLSPVGAGKPTIELTHTLGIPTEPKQQFVQVGTASLPVSFALSPSAGSVANQTMTIGGITGQVPVSVSVPISMASPMSPVLTQQPIHIQQPIHSPSMSLPCVQSSHLAHSENSLISTINMGSFSNNPMSVAAGSAGTAVTFASQQLCAAASMAAAQFASSPSLQSCSRNNITSSSTMGRNTVPGFNSNLGSPPSNLAIVGTHQSNVPKSSVESVLSTSALLDVFDPGARLRNAVLAQIQKKFQQQGRPTAETLNAVNTAAAIVLNSMVEQKLTQESIPDAIVAVVDFVTSGAHFAEKAKLFSKSNLNTASSTSQHSPALASNTSHCSSNTVNPLSTFCSSSPNIMSHMSGGKMSSVPVLSSHKIQASNCSSESSGSGVKNTSSIQHGESTPPTSTYCGAVTMASFNMAGITATSRMSTTVTSANSTISMTPRGIPMPFYQQDNSSDQTKKNNAPKRRASPTQIEAPSEKRLGISTDIRDILDRCSGSISGTHEIKKQESPIPCDINSGSTPVTRHGSMPSPSTIDALRAVFKMDSSPVEASVPTSQGDDSEKSSLLMSVIKGQSPGVFPKHRKIKVIKVVRKIRLPDGTIKKVSRIQSTTKWPPVLTKKYEPHKALLQRKVISHKIEERRTPRKENLADQVREDEEIIKGSSHSHPLIHGTTSSAALLPQAAKEEEVEDSPLYSMFEQEERRKRGEAPAKCKSRDGPHLMFEVTSDDGFHCRCNTLQEAWKMVTDKVQDARADAKMKQLSFGGINGMSMFGLNHDGLVFLIEQLYGARHCRTYPFKHHYYDHRDLEDEPEENPNGCARAEPFTSRNPHDMFSFLLSKHRPRPQHVLMGKNKCEEMSLLSQRRATSMDLPMAMRFRHLRLHAKEAVGVYRSDIHGRGLFCKRAIDAGEMVIEYAGEIIRSALTDKREQYYESKGIGCYMFRIDDYDVVDATVHGNAARFINHSCDPNCYSKVINVDGKKHIVIFAMRPISRGEELTYDYKFPIEEVKIPCSCGSKRCRKYLN